MRSLAAALLMFSSAAASRPDPGEAGLAAIVRCSANASLASYNPVCSGGVTYVSADWLRCVSGTADGASLGACPETADKMACMRRCTEASPSAPYSPVCAYGGFTYSTDCLCKCDNATCAAGECFKPRRR